MERPESILVAGDEGAKSRGRIEREAIHVDHPVAPHAFDLTLVIKYPTGEMIAPLHLR